MDCVPYGPYFSPSTNKPHTRQAKTALDETLAALQSENREGRSTITQLTHVVEVRPSFFD